MKYLHADSGSFEDPASSPNWVSSQTQSSFHFMPPIAFAGDPDGAFDHLARIVEQFPRTVIVERSDLRLHAEVRSRILRFVDDLEFQVIPEQSVIHFCSSSRAGWSDFGVNRRRMVQIHREFDRTERSKR